MKGRLTILRRTATVRR